MIKGFGLILLSLIVATSLQASPFDGLYRPSAPFGEDWSCDPMFLGMDGGALGVADGYLQGVENSCRLQEERQIGRERIQYLATCSGEGSTSQRRVIIARTPSGISLDYGRDLIYWTACPSQAATVADGRWEYSPRRASIVQDGMSFGLTCQTFNPSSTLPVANLAGFCPACAPFDTTTLTLVVDGTRIGTFEFVKVNNAEGWRGAIQSYPSWYHRPILELTEGRSLTILENGRTIASFSLSGSADAIGALRDRCN